MTAANKPPFKEYVENGVTVAFGVPFRFNAPAHVAARRIAPDGAVTDLAYGPDYSVTGGSTDDGGTLTVVAAAAAGVRLQIRRVTPRVQGMQYATADTFPAESHEAAIDKAMLVDQEQDVAIGDVSDRALKVPLGEIAGELPPKADLAGKFLGGDALGNPVALEGTGNDAAFRTDMGASDPARGASLFSVYAPGAGAVKRLGRAKLAERITPEDYGASGAGVGDDATAFTTAAMRAVGAGAYLRGRRGAIYQIEAGMVLPAGLHFDGEGCTIRAATHMEMVTLLGGGARFTNCTIEGPDDGGYDVAGKGIVLHGTAGAGPGVAPVMAEDLGVEAVTFIGIGHTALDLWYCSGIRSRDLVMRRLGYAGVVGYSIEDFDGKGFDVDTIYGETLSGEMNAYAATFTSAVNGGDDVRYPPSRRCYAHEGKVSNMPTWHALDTHGGRVIGFQDWELYDVRRAMALTNRGDDSAQDCYAKRIRSFNTLPFALDAGGEPTAPSVNAGVSYGGTADKLKKDSALWITGVAGSPSRNMKIDDFFAEGHGRPGQINGSYYFENCDVDARSLVDKDGYINGVYAPTGVTGSIEHWCINPQAWDDGAYPGGSYGNLSFDTVRPLDARGGDLKYQGRYTRTSALPANTFDLDFLISAAGVANKVEIVGNGVRGKSGGGHFISGDAAYVTGNYSRGIVLTAGVGEFSGAPPSGSVLCAREGAVISLDLPTIGGTSTSAAFTLGTLPPNFRPSSAQICVVRVTDAGVAMMGLLSIATSGLITLLVGPGGVAWTVGGTKNVLPCSVSFWA